MLFKELGVACALHDLTRLAAMRTLDDAGRSLAPQIRAVLSAAFGKKMADRIIIGSCNILSIDESELFGANLDLFLSRMEIVVPAIIGIKPGEAIVERLWELKHDPGP